VITCGVSSDLGAPLRCLGLLITTFCFLHVGVDWCYTNSIARNSYSFCRVGRPLTFNTLLALAWIDVVVLGIVEVAEEGIEACILYFSTTG